MNNIMLDDFSDNVKKLFRDAMNQGIGVLHMIVAAGMSSFGPLQKLVVKQIPTQPGREFDDTMVHPEADEYGTEHIFCHDTPSNRKALAGFIAVSAGSRMGDDTDVSRSIMEEVDRIRRTLIMDTKTTEVNNIDVTLKLAEADEQEAKLRATIDELRRENDVVMQRLRALESAQKEPIVVDPVAPTTTIDPPVVDPLVSLGSPAPKKKPRKAEDLVTGFEGITE